MSEPKPEFKGRYRLLSEKEVEQWFGIKASTLQKMRSNASKDQVKDPLPYVKIGGAVRYREDQLLKWLDRNTIDSVD